MMKNFIKSTLVLAILFGSYRASAQEAAKYSFSLKQAEEFAVKNSYEVIQKQLDIDDANQTIRETRAIGLPQLSTSLDFTYNPQITEQPIPAAFIDSTAPDDAFVTQAFGTDYQNIFGIRLNQLIFDASYFVALRATKVYKQTVALDQEQAEINAKKSAAQAYYAVLVAEHSYDIAKDNLESVQNSFNETTKLFENGFVEEQDADQLELMVNSLQSTLRNAERQVVLARKMLNFVLGIPVNQRVELTNVLDDVIITPGLMESLGAKTFSHEGHIAYRNLLSQERGMLLQLKNERTAWYPKINGFVSHNQSRYVNGDLAEAFNVNADWISGTAIGAGLSWNLFNGFSTDAKIQSAKIDLQRIELSKATTVNNLQMAYETALSDFTFAYDNYNNQKRNVELSKKIKNQTEKKYKEGISSSLDLTQAQNQLLENQSTYFNALLQLLNAKEELENALGE